MMPLRHCSGVISVIDSQLSSSVTLVMPALLTSRSIGPEAGLDLAHRVGRPARDR